MNPSYQLRIHMLAAMVGLTSLTLAVIAFGLRIFSKSNRNLPTAFGLVLGLVAFSALLLFPRAAYLRLALGVDGVLLSYPGLVQKTIVFSTDLWIFITASYILSALKPTLYGKLPGS